MKITFIAAAVGLALLIAGAWAEVEACTNVGYFVLPLSFLWGGLMQGEERFGLRVTMLIIGAVLVAIAIQKMAISGLNLSGLGGLF